MRAYQIDRPNQEQALQPSFEVLSANGAPVIDIWYGLNQEFGQLGDPQDRINILGNARDPDGDDLTVQYKLNDGSFQPVTLGPFNPRLVETGDFNIEIYIANLKDGTNSVLITAEDSQGNQASVSVNVTYHAGNSWPIPYTSNWSGSSLIQDRGQIIDGKWILQDGGVRTTQIGYDRLIGIGETSWRQYDVSVPFTVYRDAGNGGIGVILRWRGHTGSNSPATNWTEIGAYGYYSFRLNALVLRLNGTEPPPSLQKDMGNFLFGTQYMLRMRVEGGDSGTYSLKMWPASSPEPSAWDLVATDSTPSIPDISAGATLLVAHNVDAHFGNVIITPLGSSQTYTLATNVQGKGHIDRNPAKSTYTFGEQVQVRATPDSGWVFAGWTGALSGTANPATLAMDGNKTVTAIFIREGEPPGGPMMFLPLMIRQ
ncbi:MAG TPA: hypothetical protein VHO48_07820 [Anaerolineaceae bacterium]|nr:hypothetical protein [Anaerolineaceae bacterium]